MATKAGKADKRGIVSPAKALDYLSEINDVHIDSTKKNVHKECIEYLGDVIKTQEKALKDNVSTNKKLSEKLDKILKTIKPENLIDLVKEL